MASLSYLGLADESGGTCWAGGRHPGLTLSWGATSRMVLTPTGVAHKVGKQESMSGVRIIWRWQGAGCRGRGEGCHWGRDPHLEEGGAMRPAAHLPAWRTVRTWRTWTTVS